MKKRWTNQKLFNQIVENLREDGKLPDILEHISPAYVETEVNTYKLDCLGTQFPRRFEGSWVSVYLTGRANDIQLGVFDTLQNDKESWDIMAQLMADFQWECMAFIEDHFEEFEGGDE